MNPYLQIAMGVLAGLVVALVMFVIGRKFLTQDRQRDKQSGSDREAKDADKAVIEQARSQLESERKDTARTVELSRQTEAARIEQDRKEAAGSLEAEQRRLAERVGKVEKGIAAEGELKGQLKDMDTAIREHHTNTSIHIDPTRDRQIWTDFKADVMRGFARVEEKIEKLIHPKD